MAENLHPVANPAVDAFGNIYTTFSGSRGQKVPVSVYRIDLNFNLRPFINDLMNPTGIAAGPDGLLYISSRFDGVVYQVSQTGNMSVFVEGMGVATGICFDPAGNLYVGDRSGTIFKVSSEPADFRVCDDRAFDFVVPSGVGTGSHLYVSGPTTSSFDSIYRIADNGDVETFYRGLGRPQGMAFDADGNLYSAASYMGRKGVVRITQAKRGAFPFGAGHCRAGVFAVALDAGGDHERDPSRGCGDSRISGFLHGSLSAIMNAEIIAVGSEMLTAGRLDTNSLFITEHLNSLGIEVTAKHVIGDDRERLATAIRRGAGGARYCDSFGRPGADGRRPDARCSGAGAGRRRSPMPEICRRIETALSRDEAGDAGDQPRQAMVLEGADILQNERGTAPGQWIGERRKSVVMMLPGPPSELKSMFTRECLPRLARIAPPAAIHTVVLRSDRHFRIAAGSDDRADL